MTFILWLRTWLTTLLIWNDQFLRFVKESRLYLRARVFFGLGCNKCVVCVKENADFTSTRLEFYDCIVTSEMLDEVLKKFPLVTRLTFFNCFNLKSIPLFRQLTVLECYNCPMLKTIPKELVNLEILCCDECENLNELPKELVNLKGLLCSSLPYLKEIPKEFTKLNYLICSDSNLEEIPKELSHLFFLICSRSKKLQRISDEIFQLSVLRCDNCPILESIPVATTIDKTNSPFLDEFLGIQHIESYYAPTGKGAQELFKKYKHGFKLE